jgi:hypothetical protein
MTSVALLYCWKYLRGGGLIILSMFLGGRWGMVNLGSGGCASVRVGAIWAARVDVRQMAATRRCQSVAMDALVGPMVKRMLMSGFGKVMSECMIWCLKREDLMVPDRWLYRPWSWREQGEEKTARPSASTI